MKKLNYNYQWLKFILFLTYFSIHLQIPCFFLWMVSIRRMSLDGHPGFDCVRHKDKTSCSFLSVNIAIRKSHLVLMSLLCEMLLWKRINNKDLIPFDRIQIIDYEMIYTYFEKSLEENYIFTLIDMHIMKGQLGSMISSFAMRSEVVGSNKPLCKKKKLGCLVYSIPQLSRQVGTGTELTLL